MIFRSYGRIIDGEYVLDQTPLDETFGDDLIDQEIIAGVGTNGRVITCRISGGRQIEIRGNEDVNAREIWKGMIITAILIALTIGFFAWVLRDKREYVEYEYNLSEIEPGIYATYKTVSSAAPAYNYQMITLCVNGQIVTYQGIVKIIYSDDPHVFISDCNIINSDEITAFVPKNSIRFNENISIN